MYNGKYIPMEDITSEVMRRFPFKNYPTDEDTLEAIVSVMRGVLPYHQMEDHIAVIDIEDGRGELPIDLEIIIRTAINLGDSNSEPFLVPMRWSTDSFHLRNHLFDIDYLTPSQYTYTLNNNYIFPNIETGCLWMAYKRLPVNDEGQLQVPDEESYRMACIYELAHTMALRAGMQDELADRWYQRIERDRDWYKAQAGNAPKIGSIEMVEAETNTLTKMFSTDVYSTFFASMTMPEFTRIHKAR